METKQSITIRKRGRPRRVRGERVCVTVSVPKEYKERLLEVVRAWRKAYDDGVA